MKDALLSHNSMMTIERNFIDQVFQCPLEFLQIQIAFHFYLFMFFVPILILGEYFLVELSKLDDSESVQFFSLK